MDGYLWAAAIVVLAVLLVNNCRLARRRRRCLAFLNAREDNELHNECKELAATADMQPEEVERLWLALAREYGLPPRKIRLKDRVDRELAGALHHPDYDAFSTPVVIVCDRRLVNEQVAKARCWGDLIAAMRALERESGRLFPGWTPAHAGKGGSQLLPTEQKGQ